MRILVADDDSFSATVLSSIVAPYGTCDIVADGVEAIDAFKNAWNDKNPYDVVFLDIVMPKVTGIEALQAMRDFEGVVGASIGNRVKVIMVTAYDNYKRTLSSFDYGCDAYIMKPAEPERIGDVLAELGLIAQGGTKGI